MEKIAALNTFEAVARRWWAKHVPTWSAEYANSIMSHLEADVSPDIGAVDIEALKPAHLKEMTERIRARGVTETARRALQDVGQVLIHTDLPDISLSQHKKLPAYKVKHMAAITKPPSSSALSMATLAASWYATRFAPLVFVRPGELRAAKWADIDLNGAE